MSDAIIAITDKAKDRLKEIVQGSPSDQDRGVRIGVIGGGCSGLSYHIDFGDVKEHDHIIRIEGVRIFVDPKSAIYLKRYRTRLSRWPKGEGVYLFKTPTPQTPVAVVNPFPYRG